MSFFVASSSYAMRSGGANADIADTWACCAYVVYWMVMATNGFLSPVACCRTVNQFFLPVCGQSPPKSE